MIDLADMDEYTFTAGPLDESSRFMLHFKNSQPSAIKDGDLQIYSYGSSIFLDATNGADLPQHAEVYDLAGNCIFTVKLNGNGLNVLNPGASAGLYLVKVYTISTIHSGKVFLK